MSSQARQTTSPCSLMPAMKLLAREGMRSNEPMKQRKAEREIERDARRYGWTDQMIETLPPEWQWRVCTARLQLGYLDWRGWEWRDPRGGHDPFDIPRWKAGLPVYHIGKPLQEPETVENLLVYSEQGIGDQLMFARAIPFVRPYARNITIEVEPRLAPIFRRTFPDMRVHALHDLRDASWVKPGEFDAKVLMGTLVARFLRSTADFIPFGMSADPALVEKWSCYRGRTAFSFHGRQGIIPESFFPEDWLCLQYGRHHLKHEAPPIDLTDDLEDIFGILANVDKVVTVANTLAHMSASLDVPTDVIMSKQGEINNAVNYRWGMPGDRTMPWHPSVRIYRNEKQWEAECTQSK